MANIAHTKYTSQYIDNMSFDEDYHVLVNLPVEYDPAGKVTRSITPNLTVRIYNDGTYNYVCEATPGSLTTASVWRVQRIDSSGNVLYADGNSNFDNQASSYSSLNYS